MSTFKQNLKWYLPALILFFTLFIWYTVWAEGGSFFGSTHKNLKVAFLDVGQGDAIFIESPTGKQILIDGGPPGRVKTALPAVMPFYDHSIDMIVITNPDQDHIAGFTDILDAYDVEYVLEPGTNSPSKIYASLEKKIEEEGAKKIIAKRGMIFDLGDGSHLDILFPDKDVSDWKTNDGSIVSRLVYGETSVMLQGDAPSKTEKYLIGLDGANLKSDILKTGHHGSRTSTSEDYVKVVSPYYAVISDGKDNKYGHPHKEVLDVLHTFGVKTLRTDELGTIIFESDGNFLYEKHK